MMNDYRCQCRFVPNTHFFIVIILLLCYFSGLFFSVFFSFFTLIVHVLMLPSYLNAEHIAYCTCIYAYCVDHLAAIEFIPRIST